MANFTYLGNQQEGIASTKQLPTVDQGLMYRMAKIW
jgi:hypothetical protein